MDVEALPKDARSDTHTPKRRHRTPALDLHRYPASNGNVDASPAYVQRAEYPLNKEDGLDYVGAIRKIMI